MLGTAHVPTIRQNALGVAGAANRWMKCTAQVHSIHQNGRRLADGQRR
jgi:hypothetical protein